MLQSNAVWAQEHQSDLPAMVTEVFKSQLGQNMEVYVDDMIVKRKVVGDHLTNLKETFDRLRFHQMKLNPQKSVFGVVSLFLGKAWRPIQRR